MSRKNKTFLNSSEWLRLANEGAVSLARIVAVGQVEAAPIRRLIQAVQPSHVLILTGGRKRQTVLILDSGHLVITALTMTEVLAEITAHQDKLLFIE
ncbi:MAG: DUF370 domain-containing protein [Ardenticatenaceae bacterium]|nr:DUF370 domain-containing protein [Ardenticatenaceae bacterium]